MSESSANNDYQNGWEQYRANADLGREPKLLPGQLGNRWISLAALVERIEVAFIADYGEDSATLRDADTTSKRLKLILETADYVLATESVQLSAQDKADVVSQSYSNLFSYGPLDALFLDERVTTISLDGADKVSVRYGHGDLVSLGPLFQDESQMRRIVRRLLLDAGAELRDDQPFVEVGLVVDSRPVSVSFLAPPIAFRLSADIRLHPKSLPEFDTLLSSGFMTRAAQTLLRAVVESDHGFMVVGESESGKTTLLSLLTPWLPNPDRAISVERAGELRLPTGIERLLPQWSFAGKTEITFGQQIANALAKMPATIILDEIRADEPHTIAPLLELEVTPRQIWSFRGTVFAKRLQSALGMLARRSTFGQDEEVVRQLYERLPFVISVINVNGELKLWSIAEWQFQDNPNYPTYTLLMQTEGGSLKLAGNTAVRPLNLPSDFWE